MPKIKRFEDIEAWQVARELTKRIYACTRISPFAKDFGLRDQIQRATVSIMSNIAEGFERDGDRELTQFLSLAKGSCGEVRSQLYVALDQGYVTRQQFDEIAKLAVRVSQMLSALMQYLRRSSLGGTKYKSNNTARFDELEQRKNGKAKTTET